MCVCVCVHACTYLCLCDRLVLTHDHPAYYGDSQLPDRCLKYVSGYRRGGKAYGMTLKKHGADVMGKAHP